MPPYVRWMLVQCPSCAAAYEVPDHLLKAGPRLMQCAKCHHTFHAPAPVPAPVPTPEHALAPAPLPPPGVVAPAEAPPLSAPRQGEPASTTPPKPHQAPPAVAPDRPALLGWAATICVLALGGTLLVRHHAALAQAWPPSARLFQWLGLG